jgi:hypothetical protein
MKQFFGSLLLFAAVSIASPTKADSLPAGFEEHKFNGPTAPSTNDGVTTFQIFDGGCSKVDYGDGRGESDCNRGNVRSTMVYEAQARIGQVKDYRFDVKIAQNFAYPGRFHAETAAFIPGGWDSHLRIASWEGPALHNFLYMVKVDGRNGVTFLGKQCQSPEQFGEWVSFSMKVRWSSDESGWIKVTCDDKIVYANERVATNQAPHCWEFTNQCKEGEFRNPNRFHYILGPVMLGNGSDYGSNFTPIQEGGITIQMRNVEVGREAELYDPKDVAVIKQLQETLNALGCDVGTPDGVAGPRTRAAALDCRRFEASLPTALNVGTAAAFLAAYSAEGVTELPRGGGTTEPKL